MAYLTIFLHCSPEFRKKNAGKKAGSSKEKDEKKKRKLEDEASDKDEGGDDKWEIREYQREVAIVIDFIFSKFMNKASFLVGKNFGRIDSFQKSMLVKIVSILFICSFSIS